MNDKSTFVSVQDEFLSEVLDDGINWQLAAQTLAFLGTGINGHNANDTLRIGRAKLGKLFDLISHDVACWREIASRSDASDFIRVFAEERANALDELCKKAQKRFEAWAEGRE